MKIGIMTFWESQDNYGQQLQAFALQTYLKNMGHEVYLIQCKRTPIPQKEKRFFRRIKTALYNLKKRVIQQYNKEVGPPNRFFDEFRKKYIKLGETEYRFLTELKVNPPKADAYICGSDQIWNNSFTISCEPYLLGFGNKETKRIAYAASFGQRELSPPTQELFKKYLGDFDAISVREKSGVNLCTMLGYKRAYWVPDPTLLFNKSQWLSMLNIKKIETGAGKRLFLYVLGNSELHDKNKYFEYFRSETALEIIHTSANNDLSGIFFPSVEQWVFELSTCNYVVTNSFHGTIFSILFEKPFIVLPNTGSASGMNERITSLLGKLNLSEHMLESFEALEVERLLKKEINWSEVNDVLNEWKKDANSFLSMALN